MAVAAAIGVGADDLDGDSRLIRHNRLNQKQSATGTSSRNSSSNLGEINRSIEKMSLGACQASSSSTMEQQQSSPKGAAAASVAPAGNNSRRDSNWTVVSTEGYGSMRSSDQQSAVSRRASELSAMSQVNRGMFM